MIYHLLSQTHNIDYIHDSYSYLNNIPTAQGQDHCGADWADAGEGDAVDLQVLHFEVVANFPLRQSYGECRDTETLIATVQTFLGNTSTLHCNDKVSPLLWRQSVDVFPKNSGVIPLNGRPARRSTGPQATASGSRGGRRGCPAHPLQVFLPLARQGGNIQLCCN